MIKPRPTQKNTTLVVLMNSVTMMSPKPLRYVVSQYSIIITTPLKMM